MEYSFFIITDDIGLKITTPLYRPEAGAGRRPAQLAA